MANDTENPDQQAQAQEQKKAEEAEQAQGAAGAGDAGAEEGGDAASEQAAADADGNSDAQPDPSEELAKVKDQLLRTVAEMENVRRRAQRDIENAHKYAVEKLLSDLLPVVDSLEKAEDAAKTTDNAASMAEGIGLSLKLFVGILEKAGVTLVDPLGEPFDPQLHEAMAMVPNPDAEPNSVMDVMQRGYTLNGRLVRAAKVVVVKGD
ncbi:MAG: nucleotide exchange factor GrpE [Gammaproteobacteria bacterium]|jgi:molecular chaperone GrpE